MHPKHLQHTEAAGWAPVLLWRFEGYLDHLLQKEGRETVPETVRYTLLAEIPRPRGCCLLFDLGGAEISCAALARRRKLNGLGVDTLIDQ